MLEVKGRQTAKFIVQKTEEILKIYDISLEQILTGTCDNGANMLAAIKALDQNLQLVESERQPLDDDDSFECINDDLYDELIKEFESRICLVRCAAHTLQLAVTDVIKHTDIRIRSITNVVKNCRKIAYRDSFHMHNVPIPPMYSKTRWGGVYEMIFNLFEHESFYKDLGDQFKELDLSEHRDFIHEYENALKPLYISTKEMQAKHLSLGDFYIQWLRCLMEVKQLTTNELAKSLIISLTTRLQQLKNNFAFKAALLIDPRFNYLSSAVFMPEEKESIRNFIIATSKRIRALKPVEPVVATPSVPEPDTVTQDLDDFMTDLFGGVPPSANNDNVGQGQDSFIKQLNALDLENHQNHKYDIWKHWKDRINSHPELAEVALSIMSVPSTQVSVERSFSGLALVLSPARTNLTAKNLENILLVKLNSELLKTIIPNMYDWKQYQGLSALLE
ncbi:uncharacterized protein LOC129757363 [Uranotaenia lowii]|uniref:uncharacterized protein LOC129757363 n=1 Tax=Uranotaenia lowii TaxID=190385 RepID=UPI002478A1FF|nr:uncharacterized protein LOC129757363 [Uranotaenia lowii]